MMIGVPGNSGEVDRRNMGRYGDKGISKFFWQPKTAEDIKDLALKIGDEIAAGSCVKV